MAPQVAVHSSYDVPVYKPHFTGREEKYVVDCIRSGWISSRGEYVGRFEDAFKSYIGANTATSVCNGTVALHLALAALNLGPGDEVIVPTFTYVASVNAIAYVGATPVFVDSVPGTWQMDPEDVERKISSRTKMIMAVHLYGQACDIIALRAIADRHGLLICEDAAEAFGTMVGDTHVGNIGDVATFSFFGNKTITTGEGGMVVARDTALAARLAKLKSQGQSTLRFWHDEVGYNFRMTNIAAAIGLAQIESANEILDKKREVFQSYSERLQGAGLALLGEEPGTTNSFWMCCGLLPRGVDRDALMAHLENNGIESRPSFYPVHTMPMYIHRSPSDAFPVANDLGQRGICLPSYPDMTEFDLDKVTIAIRNFLAG